MDEANEPNESELGQVAGGLPTKPGGRHFAAPAASKPVDFHKRIIAGPKHRGDWGRISYGFLLHHRPVRLSPICQICDQAQGKESHVSCDQQRRAG
jgi:hypothetical protein